MGATGWSFFRPYQEDMNAVLQTLQQDVFLSGDYERPLCEIEELELFEFFEADRSEQRELLERYGLHPFIPIFDEVGPDGLVLRLEQLQRKASISRQELDVLMCLSYSGTSSILDISGIADGPNQGALFPLSKDALLLHLGTDQPTHEMVEKWRQRIIPLDEQPLYRRGEGIFFTVFQDGKPDEIYIEGCSGD